MNVLCLIAVVSCCTVVLVLDQDGRAMAISIIPYMNLEFQLSSQHMCVCVCVCVYACMHAGACVITHMHEDSCIDIVHYGKHTNILTTDSTKICNISGFHTVEYEDSGHLGCYIVFQS